MTDLDNLHERSFADAIEKTAEEIDDLAAKVRRYAGRIPTSSGDGYASISAEIVADVERAHFMLGHLIRRAVEADDIARIKKDRS